MLTDNNAAITDAAFTDDDAKVITTAADGAVYSWIVGTIVRDGEFLQKGVAATRIAVGRCTLEKGYEDIFIACFDNQADNLHFASEVVRKRKQSSMMTRRISQAVSTDKGIDGKKEETPSISLPAGAKSFADFSRKGSVCDGEGLSFLGAVKSANTIKNVEKKSFLAVWTNNIGVNASIICTEVPVRAVAIGESEGPDKTSLCVLGMVDGSVVITTLPLPTIILRVNETVPVNISSSVSITHGSITLGGRRNRRRSAIIANDDVFAAESANSSQNGSSKDGTSAASVSVASSQPDMRLMYSANQTASPHMQQAANTATVTNNPQSQPNYLDLSQCAVFNLHVDAVTHTAISTNGMWIFSVGVDGIIFMLATSRRGQDLAEFPETSKYLVIDRLELQRLRGKLSETDTKIELLKKDHELLISKLVEDKNKHLHDVETKLKKEIQKREDTIFHGRAEYLALLSSKKSDVAAIEKQCADAIAELELSYERKFAQDSLYLNKMKQAYDEYVLHTRMDLEEMQKKTTAKVDSVEKEKLLALKEAEKQKKAVLQYFEFLKLRNGEVINSIEDQQVEERCRMKEELEKTTKALKEAQQHKLTDLAQTHIREQKLQADINNKEIEIMTLKADVDWANNRILNLENSLQQATAELKLRSNDSERWEYKSGELQQKIVDLERYRD